MNVITLREYARQKNISYEAVRKQVVRYKDELNAHIIQDGRQQFLDEDAVAFLDAKRQKNPVAIIQQNKDEQIEQLEDEVKTLLVKIAAQADRISELSEWKSSNAQLIASAEQTRLALEAANKDKELLEGVIADAKAELQVLTAEKEAEATRARQELKAKEKAMEEEKRRREAAEAELQAYIDLPWWKRIFK